MFLCPLGLLEQKFYILGGLNKQPLPHQNHPIYFAVVNSLRTRVQLDIGELSEMSRILCEKNWVEW